jgi:hypothetical protein
LAIPRRQPRWLAGILLTLILLGHDGIMATAAHAEPAPTTQAHAQVHAPSEQPATPAVAAADYSHQPGHPAACGVAGTAVPTSAHRLALTDVGETAKITAVDLNRTTSPSIGGADEPFWPPGTRRALLQVYRI